MHMYVYTLKTLISFNLILRFYIYDKCWYWFEIAKMLISLIIHPSKILDSCHSSEIFGKSKTDSPFQTFNLPHTLKADFDSNILMILVNALLPLWEQNNIILYLANMSKKRSNR